MKEATEKVTDQFRPFLERMQEGSAKDYIECRLLDQMQWYDRKSVKKQRHLKALSLAVIVINAVIPVVMLLSEYGIAVRVGIAAVSAAAGVISAVVNLCRYQDLWVQYRAGCEYLKGVLYRYFMRIGEFAPVADDPAQCDRLLQSLCEDYFSNETRTWHSIASQSNEKTGSHAALPEPDPTNV